MELARRRNAFAMSFYEPLYTHRRIVGIELWWEKIRLTAARNVQYRCANYGRSFVGRSIYCFSIFQITYILCLFLGHEK